MVLYHACEFDWATYRGSRCSGLVTLMSISAAAHWGKDAAESLGCFGMLKTMAKQTKEMQGAKSSGTRFDDGGAMGSAAPNHVMDPSPHSRVT